MELWQDLRDDQSRAFSAVGTSEYVERTVDSELTEARRLLKPEEWRPALAETPSSVGTHQQAPLVPSNSDENWGVDVWILTALGGGTALAIAWFVQKRRRAKG